MHTQAVRKPLRRMGVMLASVIAILAALVFAATATAATGTQTWTGQNPGPTPDIERSGLTVYDASGVPIPPLDIAGTLNFTLNGEQFVGVCVDLANPFDTSVDVPVNFETTTPAPGSDEAALAWILAYKLPSGDPNDPALQQQAAAAQVASWLLADGGNISATQPTDDDGLNAAAFALIAEARAATSAPLAMSAAAPAAGARTAVITVSGSPGTVVDLTATGGTLSGNQVTLGADGTATVTLAVTAAGTATVNGTAAGAGAELIRINPTADPKTQATATATPVELVASTQVQFTDTPPTPPVTPPTPPVTPPTPPVTPPTPPVTPPTPPATPPTVDQARTPALRVVKAGPKRARGLSRVTYRITVRNTGDGVARNVVLVDTLPRGLTYVSSTKGTFRRGKVTFRIGTLRPGQAKTVRVRILAPSNTSGRRVNVVRARATGVRPVRAQAVTVFRPLVRRVSPAVTG